MAFYEWKDNFSVGISEMDEQHKKMVGILNRLYEAMKAGKASKELTAIIDEMIDYTKYHFGSEEKLMEKFSYSGLAAQKEEHATFVKKSLEFQDQVASGKLAVSIEVMNFLKDWWTNHILVSDKKYSGMQR